MFSEPGAKAKGKFKPLPPWPAAQKESIFTAQGNAGGVINLCCLKIMVQQILRICWFCNLSIRAPFTSWAKACLTFNTGTSKEQEAGNLSLSCGRFLLNSLLGYAKQVTGDPSSNWVYLAKSAPKRLVKHCISSQSFSHPKPIHRRHWNASICEQHMGRVNFLLWQLD